MNPTAGLAWMTAGSRDARSYVIAAVLVALTVAAAVVFRRIPHANLSLLFLAVVLIIAARWGLWPSIFASALSFLALNFFFTQPLYTFAVEAEGDVATLLFFLAMAGLTGNLAARMRREAANNRAALDRVSALLDFSRRMAAATDAREALHALAARLARTCSARALVLSPDAEQCLRVDADSASDASRAALDPGAAERAWQLLCAGQTPRIPGWTILPVGADGSPLGLVAIEGSIANPDQKALIAGFCDQASIAVERAALVEDLRAAELTSETERLRSALLSSVSHDLRTPLVSIIGSTTSLLEYASVLKPGDRRELLGTVLDEAHRLNRYIQNLLDMTRFGRQPFDLKREWVDLNDLVSAAVERLGSALAHVELRVAISPEVALIRVHGTLIEQVLVNLLDNAAGFAPRGSTVEVSAGRHGEAVVIELTDAGCGIPPGERERVFDMFHRATPADTQRSGTGLGLAICRSIVSAHGGTISAGAGPGGRGARLRIELPLSANPTESVNDDSEPADHRGRRADSEVSAHQS